MPLEKADLHAGMILWLSNSIPRNIGNLSVDHHGQHNEYGGLGIDEEGLNHPVAIIDTMLENEHRVWVSSVSLPASDITLSLLISMALFRV